ncbi:Os01g0699450, partial [Oryza sativa Japonica Group]
MSSMSLHGARPVAISMMVQPRAQTSAAGPCSSPRATSGAMNAGVPPIGPAESMTLAHPKSVSLARPSLPITTFLALTSPCTSEFPWRYASPLATSAAYARMAGSGRQPPFLAASSASDPPGANSRNSWYSPPAAARDPRQGTMCGEQSPDRTRPSRRSCAAAPPAEADLTAMSSPESSSDASHTTAPDAPRPSVRTRLSCLA